MLRPYLSAMAIAVNAPVMRWRNTPTRLTRISGRSPLLRCHISNCAVSHLFFGLGLATSRATLGLRLVIQSYLPRRREA